MTDPKMSDEDIEALADAERDAGIPDQQTAAAAAEARARHADDEASEAHPS